jgi:hypothetical protein
MATSKPDAATSVMPLTATLPGPQPCEPIEGPRVRSWFVTRAFEFHERHERHRRRRCDDANEFLI